MVVSIFVYGVIVVCISEILLFSVLLKFFVLIKLRCMLIMISVVVCGLKGNLKGWVWKMDCVMVNFLFDV